MSRTLISWSRRSYGVLRRLTTAQVRIWTVPYSVIGIAVGLVLAVYLLPASPWLALAFVAVSLFQVPSVLAVRRAQQAEPPPSPDLRRPD